MVAINAPLTVWDFPRFFCFNSVSPQHDLVGGLAHVLFFHREESSQLIFIFFRGIGQPPGKIISPGHCGRQYHQDHHRTAHPWAFISRTNAERKHGWTQEHRDFSPRFGGELGPCFRGWHADMPRGSPWKMGKKYGFWWDDQIQGKKAAACQLFWYVVWRLDLNSKTIWKKNYPQLVFAIGISLEIFPVWELQEKTGCQVRNWQEPLAPFSGKGWTKSARRWCATWKPTGGWAETCDSWEHLQDQDRD